VHRLLQIVLLPVLAAQAVWVVARALRLPEADGARHGVCGTGPDLRLLIVGDSSAAGVGVQSQQDALAGQLVAQLSVAFRVIWRLEARTGVTSHQALTRLRQVAPEPVDVAVVALGVNDATRLLPTAGWVRTGKALRRMLREDFGVQHIYVTDLPPLGEFPALPEPLACVIGRHASRLSNAQAEALRGEPDTDLVRFDMPLDPELMARDGFHPGAEVYALWAREVAARIWRDMA
jgi:lysophospholipase L1-like esterase